VGHKNMSYSILYSAHSRRIGINGKKWSNFFQMSPDLPFVIAHLT
jgi:hypothetical protein